MRRERFSAPSRTPVRIILDESVPIRLKEWLAPQVVETVPGKGWSGIKNGRLLALISGQYDLFITADKNLEFQQNLSAISFCVLVLPTNRLNSLVGFRDAFKALIESVQPGQILHLA